MLHVIPAVGSVYGGASKFITGLMRHLKKHLEVAHLITTNADGSKRLDVELNQWLETDGYSVQYFPCAKVGEYKLSREMAQWLWKNVKNYDVVHTHAVFSLTNWPAYWICQAQGIPYIVSCHGMLEPWCLEHKKLKKKLSII